ncbi:uncharacterized protein LOC127001284 isoform X2 [Eriocheir sinensis]|uniref:uncharacterized protein LOC127001284 isoform X2 n=1 Tax=Eriocheir sinensis TaxID=95602 RepID=UPI0021C97BFB|nr:uncharacterized protein LOC127001284 isoform X2 [Eriocheir sinensis]
MVGLLPVIGWYNYWESYENVCFFVKVMSYDYLVFIYFGTIVGPGILMAAFYAHIYSVVLKQTKLSVRSEHGTLRQIAAQEPQADAASVGTQSSQRQRSNFFRTQSRGQVSESSRYDPHRASTNTNLANQVTHASRREVKAAKSLSIIVLFFMISWFPLYTINCVQAFCKECKVSEGFMFFTIILTHLNSAINPFLYAYHMQDFRLALKSFILHRILRRPADPDLAFNRSLASVHHNTTVHRVNVADSPYLTNLHTPHSHNSPVSGSPLPGMSVDGIRSRSSTVGSFGPWDSYKGLSASVSFPSSPAFTTSSSVPAHAGDLLSYRQQAAALNSPAGLASSTHGPGGAEDSSQPLLPSGVTLCVPPVRHAHMMSPPTSSHNGDLAPPGPQPHPTGDAASEPLLMETCDVTDVTVTPSSPKWSVGPDAPDQDEELQMSDAPGAAEDLPGEACGTPICLQSSQTAESVAAGESVCESLCDTSPTGASLPTDTAVEHTLYTGNGSIGRPASPYCPADSAPLPLAPKASIESLQDSPCNGTRSGHDSLETFSGEDEAQSQEAALRVSRFGVEATGAAGNNHGNTRTPTSLLSNGSALGLTHGSPDDSLSSPATPAAPGLETPVPQVTESEPSLLSRELSKYLPKILRRGEGGQRSRIFRFRNWWSQDSRQKSYHGMSLEAASAQHARRARSISGAIGT